MSSRIKNWKQNTAGKWFQKSEMAGDENIGNFRVVCVGNCKKQGDTKKGFPETGTKIFKQNLPKNPAITFFFSLVRYSHLKNQT